MDERRLVEMVKKAAKQDEQAFEELFKYYYSSVYKAAYKLCKNDADAQDITQLTFLQVRKSIHTLEKPSYFPLWLNRICVNKCKNMFRENKSELYDEEYIKYFNMAVEERRDYNSEASSHFSSDHEVLMSMIASLSTEQQKILELVYFQQLSQEEVASLLAIPVGTVKSRAFAARNALKAKVEEYERKEQVRLNFRMDSLGTLLTLFLIYKQCKWRKEMIMVTKSPSLHRTSKWLSGIGGNCLIAACAGILGIGLIGAGKEIFTPNDIHEDIREQYAFPALIVDDRHVENEVDAYYLLKGYAYDKNALHRLSKASLAELVPVLSALKDSNRHMYQQLKQEGWIDAFELELNDKGIAF